jgi:RNA polymerase sigma factor (sigma-70 family)
MGALAREFYIVPLTELASIAEDLSAALVNLRENATDPKDIRALGLLAELWSALGVKFSLLAEARGDLKTADAPKVGHAYIAAVRAVIALSPGLAIDPEYWPAYVRFGDSEAGRGWLARHVAGGVLSRWRVRFGRVTAVFAEEMQARGVSPVELKRELAEHAVATLDHVPLSSPSDDPRSSLELRVIQAAERLLMSGALQRQTEAERDEMPDRPDARAGEQAIEARLLLDELVARTELPEEDMLLVLLAYEGYSSAEIGERLGLTPGNVRVRRHRAKKRLLAAV